MGIEPYQPSERPDAEAKIYHLGGLVAGDFSAEFLKACAARGDVGLDVQGMMRFRNDDGTLTLRDWPEKQALLSYVRYLKTDAAEAEILTGTADREKAAFQLCEWGAKEVIITHNTEALVCDGTRIYRSKLCPRNLTGRTGRGDTTFAGYLCERLNHDIPEALEFAAALVSLKMETPGPFRGTRRDVEDYIAKFYR
jgi:sugar/nucleoside kinase (ribokinase family)